VETVSEGRTAYDSECYLCPGNARVGGHQNEKYDGTYVLGERMLGGGDKGASGALVLSDSEEEVRHAVKTAYPRSHPEYAGNFAVHSCKMVDGITLLPGWE
jgi:hypothetical protein